MWWIEAAKSFLAAASALFSIVNPLGGALIFAQITGDRTHADRTVLARRVMVYSAIVLLASLWIGAYVVDFFGVSIPALRVAGGLVVAASGWHLLNAPERNEDKKQAQAEDARGQDDIAFFPLTLPLTTGPGSIAVAIALGSNRPTGGAEFAAFATGTSVAALAIAAAIGFTYSWADWITNLLGKSRIRVIARLAAFILLCVGVQITMSGVTEALRAVGTFTPNT
ncbi:NAAT family transporter [Methylobacterium sp. C25]|uniref:MarC family protein n=1 Tax=Methylobacterium sp. C25 TaxID=2721622 RepID=UPI001F3AE4FD|nr:MarC family protein [Methylobacterium sp. C25]MCE4225120.1 NAAT family transporter [Methylobacterium sp. C25]